MEPVELVTLAKGVVETFLPQSAKKHIDLGFEGNEAPVIIQGHPLSLAGMLSNLVDNAILYTPPDGRVTVRLRRSEGIVLSVEDTGSGIPVAEREKVFERFCRLSENGVAGSGLGLSIVQEVADSHNAQVRISDGENSVGTIVSIHFNALHDKIGPCESST